MKRFILGAFFLVAALAGSASSAMALENTPTTSYEGSAIAQKITVVGIVPQMRLIYINSDGRLLRVVGNTDENVSPIVSMDPSNGPAKMTDAISDQYQRLLADHGGKLKAGVTYYPRLLGAHINLPVSNTLIDTAFSF